MWVARPGGSVKSAFFDLKKVDHRDVGRVPNSPTDRVLEGGPDWPILVDVND